MNPYRVEEARRLLALWQAQPGLAARHPLYGRYLEALASGDRLGAMQQGMRPLIAQLAQAPLADRMDLVDALCRALPWQGRVPGTLPVPGLPHEFLVAVAGPALRACRQAHPADARAPLWLALLPALSREGGPESPRELLAQAQDLAPQDAFIAQRLAEAGGRPS